MKKAKPNRNGLISIFLGLLFVVYLFASQGPMKVTDKNKTASDNPNYSTSQSSSLWAVVNKGRALPSGYIPAGLQTPIVPLRYAKDNQMMLLRPESARALEGLIGAADKENVHLMLVSGYRSYENQVETYKSEVDAYGVATADRESARPGHSEHQTGLAADLGATNSRCEIDQCFGDMAEGKWLAANAYRYGFIIRYQKNQELLTGYKYEPWHVRYVGDYLAAKLHTSNQTMEQYFHLPISLDYSGSQMTLSD
jgi:D-alanyl-D-alanine carboxypeptidase